MSITAYLKQIGRGKDGARALDAAHAEDLLRQVFDGRVSDVQLGAFVIAMRIKGESAAELAGFVAAAQAHIAPGVLAAVQRSARPVVWLPSYNGARKLPNLTPLLAGLLARQGLPVIVHGLVDDSSRVGSHAVFDELGWPILDAAHDAHDAHGTDVAQDIAAAWAAQRPVFIATSALCPPLARLLDVRRQTGLRNPGHTVAKLLAPAARDGAARSLRVVNHTHPEYGVSLAQFLAESKADALLLRGTEGEPVADARRTPRMDAFVAGQRIDALGVAAQGGVLARVPTWPGAIDAATTAAFIMATLAAAASGVPQPLSAQVRAITQLVQHIARPQPQEQGRAA